MDIGSALTTAFWASLFSLYSRAASVNLPWWAKTSARKLFRPDSSFTLSCEPRTSHFHLLLIFVHPKPNVERGELAFRKHTQSCSHKWVVTSYVSISRRKLRLFVLANDFRAVSKSMPSSADKPNALKSLMGTPRAATLYASLYEFSDILTRLSVYKLLFWLVKVESLPTTHLNILCWMYCNNLRYLPFIYSAGTTTARHSLRPVQYHNYFSITVVVLYRLVVVLGSDKGHRWEWQADFLKWKSKKRESIEKSQNRK